MRRHAVKRIARQRRQPQNIGRWRERCWQQVLAVASVSAGVQNAEGECGGDARRTGERQAENGVTITIIMRAKPAGAQTRRYGVGVGWRVRTLRRVQRQAGGEYGSESKENAVRYARMTNSISRNHKIRAAL